MYVDRPVFLMIVADRSPTQGELGSIHSNMKVNYLPWSPRIQVDVSAQCDMLFLPSLDNDRKAGKSHNRLVEAINAGRLAIAHPLPQYRELADFCLCDADYQKSVRIAVADPVAMRDRIVRGQQYIDKRFAQEIVAEKWEKLIEQT
jgi:hypothetical protein